jgi:hypothetical protein
MGKRVVAAVLWSYVGLIAASLTEFVFSIPFGLTAAVGFATAALLAVDPPGRIWVRARHEAMPAPHVSAQSVPEFGPTPTSRPA